MVEIGEKISESDGDKWCDDIAIKPDDDISSDPSASTNQSLPRTNRAFIGGLRYYCTKSDLWSYFGRRRIYQVDMPLNQSTNSSRGFAFVRFKTASLLEEAVGLKWHFIAGNWVEMCPAVELKRIKTRKIFVGNLPNWATEFTLMSMFSSFGPIASARIIKDWKTQLSRGYGFIVFESAEDAEILENTKNQFYLGRRQLRIGQAYRTNKEEDNLDELVQPEKAS